MADLMARIAVFIVAGALALWPAVGRAQCSVNSSDSLELDCSGNVTNPASSGSVGSDGGGGSNNEINGSGGNGGNGGEAAGGTIINSGNFTVSGTALTAYSI